MTATREVTWGDVDSVAARGDIDKTQSTSWSVGVAVDRRRRHLIPAAGSAALDSADDDPTELPTRPKRLSIKRGDDDDDDESGNGVDGDDCDDCSCVCCCCCCVAMRPLRRRRRRRRKLRALKQQRRCDDSCIVAWRHQALCVWVVPGRVCRRPSAGQLMRHRRAGRAGPGWAVMRWNLARKPVARPRIVAASRRLPSRPTWPSARLWCGANGLGVRDG